MDVEYIVQLKGDFAGLIAGLQRRIFDSLRERQRPASGCVGHSRIAGRNTTHEGIPYPKARTKYFRMQSFIDTPNYSAPFCYSAAPMYELPLTKEPGSFPEAQANAMHLSSANGHLKLDATWEPSSNFGRPERGFVASHAKHAECSDDSGSRDQDKHDGQAQMCG